MDIAWEIEENKEPSYIERQIVTAMIVNDRCLQVILQSFKPQYFTTKFSRTVAEWCIDYFTQYGKAPGNTIKSIYEIKRAKGIDETIGQLIAQFLESLSKDYENTDNFNEDYYINQAGDYFIHRGLVLMTDEVNKWLAAGNITQAVAAVSKFSLPVSISSPGREPFTNMENCRDAFESMEDELFEIPGALGELLKPIQRGSLVGLSALYKTGKSWIIDYLSLMAWYSGLNVAHFDLEMGSKKRDLRLYQAITGLPAKPPESGYIIKPVWDCELNQNGECQSPNRINKYVVRDDDGKLLKELPFNYAPCYIKDCKFYRAAAWKGDIKVSTATWRTAWKKAQQLVGDVKGARFKAKTFTAGSATFEDMDACLDIWESVEGFVADFTVVDYPALFHVRGNLSSRDKIDYGWRWLRGWSQKRNMYVLAPTQAGGKEVIRKRAGGKDLGQEDVAEDSRILGHVESMLKIDQTEWENEIGVARISKSLERHDQYKIRKQVIILQSLAAGQAVLDSKWKKSDMGK